MSSAQAVAGVAGGLPNDPLSYILPASDAAYQEALLERSTHMYDYPRLDGLFGSFGFCIAFLMIRFLWNNAFSALARRSKQRQDTMDKVEEEIWVTTGGALLLAAGWQCLVNVSGFCGLHNTAGCLAGWPLTTIDAGLHKYYNVELGWYLHLMLKHALGLGLQDNSTMGAHHVATVALIVLSYMLSLHHLGLMVFAVLNVSSPLLHLSKLASCLDMKVAKTALFALFAAVFFATRVVVFPFVILKCAMFESLASIRGIVEHFLPFWLACNVLLGVLCVMQGVWFAAVVRVLRAALCGSQAQLACEMAADPAGSGAKLVPGVGGDSSRHHED